MDIEMTAGENITPDAGESTAPVHDRDVPTSSNGSYEGSDLPKKSFDELIENEYRREYGEKVEAVVKSRLKNHAEIKKQLGNITEMLLEAGNALGVKSDDPRQIIDALVNQRQEENSDAEGAYPTEEKEGETASGLDGVTVHRVRELAQRVKDAKDFYPELDITKELKDPEFVTLLTVCKNDPKRAYEMKYHDRIITNAMHYAVAVTERKLADNMAKRSQRPLENAVSGNSAVVIAADPKSLTRQQRSDIKKRVRRGEKIFWN